MSSLICHHGLPPHALSVAGPATWNGLPTTLHQITVDHSTCLFSTLKTVLFDQGWAE